MNVAIHNMTYASTNSLFIYFLVLDGPNIHPEHCMIRHGGDGVILHPNPEAEITVNNRLVSRPVKLSQGRNQITR